jgi:hypothetical protein
MQLSYKDIWLTTFDQPIQLVRLLTLLDVLPKLRVWCFTAESPEALKP